MSVPAPTAIGVTAAEVVERLRADGRGEWQPGTLREWMREDPPCPVLSRGKPGREHLFSYPDVIDWLDARERERRHSPSDLARLEQARLTRIRADQLAGELIPVTEVELVLAQLVTAARTTISGWPARVALDLAISPEVQARLQLEVDALLAELAGASVDERGVIHPAGRDE